MVQKTVDLPVIGQHDDDFSVLAEDEEFLQDKIRFQVTLSDIKRMIDSSLLRYEENTMGRLSDGMIRDNIGSLPKIATKEATKRSLSLICGAVNAIVKQTVNCVAADNAIRLRGDRLTEPQVFAQIITGLLTKSTTSTAPISKLVMRNAEIAVMYRAKFYDPSKKVGKEKKEMTEPFPLTG